MTQIEQSLEARKTARLKEAQRRFQDAFASKYGTQRAVANMTQLPKDSARKQRLAHKYLSAGLAGQLDAVEGDDFRWLEYL